MKTHLIMTIAALGLFACASGYSADNATGGQGGADVGTGGALATGGATVAGTGGAVASTGGATVIGTGGATVQGTGGATVASTGGATMTGTGGAGGAVAGTGGATNPTGPWGPEVQTNADGSIRACGNAPLFPYSPIGFGPNDGQYYQDIPLNYAVPLFRQLGWKNGFEAWHCAGVDTEVGLGHYSDWECSPRPGAICVGAGTLSPGFMWITYRSLPY